MDMNHLSSISICRPPLESPPSERRPSSSRGRYTEEAEKFSIKGFVARRKSFFEDYFSKSRPRAELQNIAEKLENKKNEKEEDGDLSEETLPSDISLVMPHSSPETEIVGCRCDIEVCAVKNPSSNITHNAIPILWTTTSTSEIEEIDTEIEASSPSIKQKRKKSRFLNWSSNLKFMTKETTTQKNKDKKKVASNKARKAFSRLCIVIGGGRV